MNDLRTPPHRSASGLASLIGLFGAAGVAVLLASVALAVGGPLLDLPGLQWDARTWALGAAVGGCVALLLLLAWLLREPGAPAAADPARPAERAQAGAAAGVASQSSTYPAAQAAAQAATQAQLRALVQAVPQGLAFSRERRFEWANALFCDHMGWAGGELLGRSPYDLFSSVNADDSLGGAVRTAFAAGQVYAGDLPFRRRDGSRFIGRLQARHVNPGDPSAGTLWQLDDLSARPADVAAPGWAARHDPLTRLLNRAAFEAALAAWLQQAPASQTATLLHVDLDGFKAYNEAAGRDAGDALLRAAADTLQAHVRAGDAVARLDGDTYALLLPGCVAAVAMQLGQRLRTELAGLGVSHQGRRLSVSATVGVAEIDRRSGSGPGSTATASDWLARGHAAWYEAKYAGAGGVRLAAPLTRVALVLPA